MNLLILFIWFFFFFFHFHVVSQSGSMKWQQLARKTKDFLYLISHKAAIKMTFILCWEIHKPRTPPSWRVGLIAIVSLQNEWSENTATLCLSGVWLDSFSVGFFFHYCWPAIWLLYISLTFFSFWYVTAYLCTMKSSRSQSRWWDRVLTFSTW